MAQRKNLQGIRFVGVTTEGLRVLAGFFPLANSEGIPVEVLMANFRAEGIMGDWADFVCEARNHGWNMAALHTRLVTAARDVYGPVWAEGFQQRLSELYDALHLDYA